jgi:GAF domain-containing protein
MLAPTIPENEEQRLATLHGLQILDTPPEERFDRLTRIAQRVLDAPIAIVSLVDSDRQWFKSCQGLDATETPRSISFCGHTILGDKAFVVPDAALDPRFADNPLVAGAPHIRFYAGQPLKANNGSRLGTLCVIDYKPRHPSQADLDVLRDLAALVENELNLLDTSEIKDSQLRDSEAILSATINTALDAIVQIDSAVLCLPTCVAFTIRACSPLT